MKKILLFIVTLLISDMSYSQIQRGNNLQRRGMIDRDQIKERLEMMKKKLEMQLEKMEDKIDITTVNKLFDDISDLEAELRKSEFSRNLEIRYLLDDEQEVRFERIMQRKKMMEKAKMMRKNSRI